jgi:hypothetical protein
MSGVKAFGQLTEKQRSLTEIEAVSVFVQGLTEQTKKPDGADKKGRVEKRADTN